MVIYIIFQTKGFCMKKLSVFAAVFALLCTFSVCFAYDEASLSAAKELYDLGLLRGNASSFSADAMELDRCATRAEIAITVTRMLGKEQKAIYQKNAHPFTDVPDWAGDCIGWLYENYLVNGVSDTLFGSGENASVQQFCTMMLRVLGYSDKKGDFSYDYAVSTALDAGIVNEEIASRTDLLRSDMVIICRKALNAHLRNSSKTLSYKLYADRVITKQQYEYLNGGTQNTLDSFFASYEKNGVVGKAYYENGNILLQMEKDVGDYGLRVFYASDGSSFPVSLAINSQNGFTRSLVKSPFKWNEYVTLFTIHNAKKENASLKVAYTSSEGDLYDVYSVSPTIKVEEYSPYEVSLEDYFSDCRITLPAGRAYYGSDGISIKLSDKISNYGVRVVYTSDIQTYPCELAIESSSFGFVKGDVDWTSGNGLIDEITVHGLENHKNIKFVVISSTSEGELFSTNGVSPVISTFQEVNYENN